MINYDKGVMSGGDLICFGVKTLDCLSKSPQLSFSLACWSWRHKMKVA